MASCWGSAPLALLCAAGAAFAAEDGGAIYRDRCAQCHAAGTGGAPRMGHPAEWLPRVRTGLAPVHRNALHGMPNSAMAAKGGHRDLTEAQVRSAVDYLLAGTGLAAADLAAARRYDALGITDPDFLRRDADRDGFLSRAEIAGDAAIARVFAQHDADGDGRLNEGEYRRLEAALLAERTAARVDDATLAANARTALGRVKGLPLGNLKVEARDGVVTLVGVVEESHLARSAADALHRLPGLQRLDNRLVPGAMLDFD